MSIEPLESRIAPASVSPFNDVDGDLVTITISNVTANDIIGATFLSPVVGQGQHLVTLDLRAAKFEGANVSITATRDPAAGGDGTVNVGYIQATGFDLGTVFVEGDLGVIDAGDPAKPASALNGLTVHSLGVLGTSTGAPSLVSVIDGQLDKLTVKFDVKDAFLTATGKIKTVFVGGSIIGGNGAISKIAAVVIKGRALGTADSTDLVIFGSEAQHLVPLKITGLTIPLTAGAGNDLHASRRPLSATFDAGGDFDFHAFEVPVAP